jgi:hypothetical protein
MKKFDVGDTCYMLNVDNTLLLSKYKIEGYLFFDNTNYYILSGDTYINKENGYITAITAYDEKILLTKEEAKNRFHIENKNSTKDLFNKLFN